MNEINTTNDEDEGMRGCNMYMTTDRRLKPRIDCDYPAIIEGYGINGRKFNDNAKLTNLSASGLFMLTNRFIENGSKLSVMIVLSSSEIDLDAPKIATNGIVVRTEPQSNGMCGVAIKFYQYRFH